MKTIFRVEAETVRGQKEDFFDSEDALTEFLNQKGYDAFGVKGFLFISVEDEFFILKPLIRGGYELVRTYSDHSWYDITEWLSCEFEVESLKPSDIVELEIKSIKIEFVK